MTSRTLLSLAILGGVLLTGCPDPEENQNKDGWDVTGGDMSTTPTDDMDTREDSGEPVRVDMGMSEDQGPVLVDMERDMRTPPVDMDTDMDTSAPNLVFDELLRFGSVPPGTQTDKRITLTNEGGAVLELDNIVLSPAINTPFALSYPDPSAPDDSTADRAAWRPEIAPGESIDVRVTFAPLDLTPAIARIFIESNDPDTPQAEIKLDGNAGAPCVRFSGVTSSMDTDYRLSFTNAPVGMTTQKDIIVENCSRSQDLNISEVTLVDDAGGVFEIAQWLATSPGTTEAVIEPLNSQVLKIAYSPVMETSHRGVLTIQSDDTLMPMAQFELVGNGSDDPCPVAEATGTIVNSTTAPSNMISTIPLKTVQLDGSASSNPSGSIQRYEWSLVSTPTGSTTRLTPSNTTVNPRLFLDLAGEYEIALTVYDDQNTPSCTTSNILINAVPDEDIHVQLTWDTPADGDQTDPFGTDLDIHYKRENGAWDNPTFDVFWQNPEGDWGIPNDPTDNPSLDIDDTDGSGPENINHDNPAVGTYDVGVYYYNDNGFGASYATLRIYIEGLLIHEQSQQYMEKENIFWFPGSVEVTNVSKSFLPNTGTIISTGFPNAP